MFKCIFCGESWDTDLCGYPYHEFKGKFFCTSCAEEVTRVVLDDNHYGNSIGVAYFYLQEPFVRRKRRSLKANKELFKKLLLKYKFKCSRCGEKEEDKLTVDHIKPVSKGGKDDFVNLQILCKCCNSKKGAKWKETILG
ncbi:MAG: HNH endonuclease [Alphaproteobacteria bacterium]